MSSRNQVPGQPGYRPGQTATSTVAPGVSSTLPQSATASTQQRQPHDDLESWIEVSSHPSSSSVSSISDDIDTTGLQVGSANRPRRRRPDQHPPAHTRARQIHGRVHSNPDGSSQEEYDETESEEDRLLTSSTENVIAGHASHQTPLRQVFSARAVASDSSDEDDDDENATALGRRPSEPFRPQPNRLLAPTISSPSPTLDQLSPVLQRLGVPQGTAKKSLVSSALLLSIVTNRSRCTLLLKVSSWRHHRPQPLLGTSAQPAQTRRTPSSSPVPASGEKIKRTATPNPTSKPPRATKKKRMATNEDAMISPTLMTWVVSAGVVVLVSVVGFGAGYVIGREVGRQETLGSLTAAGNLSAASEGGSCGREVLKSSGGTLRRFRWGSGIGRSVMA
ncbi:hypothetical protein NPX13_g2418 [Xylaria arbuscula]|uniref:Uncharacterized protein n=1 Tax=Xylaria arbuscula TaxID=114810 RepID=A0A9W8NJ89_9PEZI|nr:hypothetical protein NPX13_g2418 [Xylaria arbuscula]